MKPAFKILSAALLFATLTDCHVQKQAAKRTEKSARSEQLHAQVLQAIENRQFIIQADQVYLHSGKQAVKSSPDTYISLQGNHGVLRLSPNLLTRRWSSFIDEENIEDQTVQLITGKIKKNGNRQFWVKINGEDFHEKWLVLFTLYNNSNKCYVQVNYENSGTHKVCFSGEIHPYSK